MFYIYILHSISADKYYVGYTNDFLRRLNQHNNSEKNTFTSKYRPWILKTVFSCGELKEEAIKIERFIKKQKSRVFLKKLIEDNELTGMLTQLVRVPYVSDYP